MTMPANPLSAGTILLMGIVTVLLGLLLVRLGRALGTLLIILGLTALIGLLAAALSHRSRATATAVTAATVAVAGQGASNLAVTMLTILLVTVVVAGGGAILYLVYRLRRAEKWGKWLPGPNARWQGGREMPPPPWWWIRLLPPPAWWEYPGSMGMGRGYKEPPIIVIDSEEEGLDLDALPWEEWGW